MTDYTIFEKYEKKTLWSRWVERFEGAMQIVATPEEKKVPLLLHYMGQEAFDVLCDKIAPDKPKNKTYKEIVDMLTKVYDPAPLEIMENYRFHLRKQADDESVEEFSIALRKLAINCKFGAYLTTALRNQIVFGLRSARIQSRLLETADLTLDNALTIAKAMELSEKGGAEIQQQKESMQSFNYIAQKSVRKSKVEPSKSNNMEAESKITSSTTTKSFCYRCGSKDHRAKKCSHRNTVCTFCNIKGHLQSVCFKASKNSQSTNYIEDDTDTTDCTEDIFTISEFSHPSKFPKFFVNLKVNDIVLGFEVDSGSPVTIVNNNYRTRYFPDEQLQSTNTKLVSYCGTEIKVFGYIVVCVNSGVECRDLRLYVVESNRKPLLGREWLHNIKLDWNKIINGKGEQVSLIKPVDINTKLQRLKDKYISVFGDSMGKIKNQQARIRLKEISQPAFIKRAFIKARKIPFALRDAVEQELEDLEQNGILQEVDSSRWATPIVPVKKKGDKVRLCGDYKITVNPRIIVEEHPLPTIEDLFASMAGGDKFSKIDLHKAYLQMEVHPDDREILTLSTHRGLFQPTRLMYGIASGPAKWQREIEQILKDIDGVSVFLDDIKITAPNDESHMQRLEQVLARLSKYNMRVNFNKCEFMAPEIEYCGYKIDRHGIHKIQSKIDAITQMAEPKNKDEVRAFLGLINYYGRFFKNLSTVIYPLNNLLKDKVKFVWDEECKTTFHNLKMLIQQEIHLVHYDPKMPLVLATDASPVGVGAVLSHVYPDGSERPIQFASQTLSDIQQRYPQIDREAYAIMYGVRKFYQYVYARKFTLITDNKPLMQILSPGRGLPTLSATRMQHYAIFLQAFEYEIQYRKSSDHSNADALSRLPRAETNTSIELIDLIEINAIETLPVTVDRLREATTNDDTVKPLIEGLQTGKTVKPDQRFNIEQTEFTLQSGCLLRGLRVYIPENLRQQVLQELHTAHFGITRMKSLARSFCWWPKLDSDIENLSKNCLQCQKIRSNPKKVPTHVWEAAKYPFERVHIDFAGPFMGKYFFILVDAYSKWPEIHIIPNITTEITINICREIFSRFGIPEMLVSDNGTQFTSDNFQHFMKVNGIQHRLSAPYHPATNGQAERHIQTFKYKLKALNCDRADISKELCKILLNYRRTPHATTGVSPSLRMFNRQIRSRLDIMLPKDGEKQNRYKEVQANIRKLNANDRVSVRNYFGDGKYKFGTIVQVLGSLHYLVKLDDGRTWKRHIDQIHRIGSEIQQPTADTIPYHYDGSEDRDLIPVVSTEITSQQTPIREVTIQPTSEPKQTTMVTEARSTPEQSRPKRTMKPKVRLTYDEHFEQST